MRVAPGVVDADAMRARAPLARCCARVCGLRPRVSRPATEASTSNVRGAMCAEALVPPASIIDGSGGSTGAMWKVGEALVWASSKSSALATAEADVEATGAAALVAVPDSAAAAGVAVALAAL